MDELVPADSSAAPARPGRRRRRQRHSVIAGNRSLPILELKPGGFVIAAEHKPRMRGYVDIMEGDRRVAHGLIICAWAEDGMVGYELQQENLAAPVLADHAPADPLAD